ncbi:MAG: iron dicitrate transporter FecR [Bradyrhizobium sp.]|nr:iron dicitrate transporter FecR [Bradyrhizobium sp.]
MSKRETAEAINDRAAEWVAQIDRAGADPKLQAELDAWLAGDPRRRGAYFRAQSTWTMLDRASALGAGYRGVDVEQPSWVSRRGVIWGGGAMAASLAATVAGITLWPRAPEHIETALGEIRRVPLKDGSLAAVNTQTRLAVNLKPDIRQISLDHGEAWFQVAKDRARPFVVSAGDVRVRAVGTAFSVRRLDQGADVQVTEGVVEVWSVGDEANIRRVAAGSRAFVRNDTGPQQVAEASTEIDRSLAWRSGQLIFDGDTLQQAAAEFNRYNTVQVTIDDPALAQEKLVGRFRTNEPDAFARAAASMLGARATVGHDQIKLSRD